MSLDIMDHLLRHVSEIEKQYGDIIKYNQAGKRNSVDHFIMKAPQDKIDKINLIKQRMSNMMVQLDNDLELCEEYIQIQIKHKEEEEKLKLKYS